MNNGRLKIVCDIIPTGDIEQDKKIIPKIITATLGPHGKNVTDINRLFNYYYNITDILAKEKTQQPNINNKIAIDYPSIAVSTINGYSFSNSLTFSSRKTDDEEQMKAFKDSLDDDNYNHKLKKLTFNYGVCGLGHKYILPTSEEDKLDGIYYKTVTDLDPRTVYCVYDNTLEQNKICAISISDEKTYDKDVNVIKSEKVYTVWTKWHQWKFVKNGKSNDGWENKQFIVENNTQDAYPIMSKQIPIIEYRSLDGTGYFELAMDLINAVNALASSRVDDVQQSVDYIITLRDIDTESEGALEKIKSCIKDGLLSFRSIQGAVVQPEIDVLDTKLNQSEIETLQKFLCDKLEEVLNIPNRNTKSSGGDTGSAVESRNGFRSLENKASIITDDIIAGENEALKVIFAICKNISSCPFNKMKTKDVEIKDNRNKYENLSNASTAYATLRSAGMNDRTALEVTRLVPDSITVSKMNEEEKIKVAEENLKMQIKSTEALSKFSNENNKPAGNNSKKENNKDDKSASKSKDGSNTK